MWLSKTRKRKGGSDILPIVGTLSNNGSSKDDEISKGRRRPRKKSKESGNLLLLFTSLMKFGILPLFVLLSLLFILINSKGARIAEPQPTRLFEPLAAPKLESLSQQRRQRFQAVQGAIQDAWNSYYDTVCLSTEGINKKFWSRHIPADDLCPINHSGHDWLHHAATLHDALDTLVIAGLHDEYNTAVDRILKLDLASTALVPTKTFEYSLRIVGGLLGAFSVTGDLRLLFRAKDAADALLESPFHSSPTVLPRMYDVLYPPNGVNYFYKLYSRIYQWGRDVFTEEHHYNSLAGVGSFALEFYFLTQVLGLPKYMERADNIFQHVTQHKQKNSVIPGMWNVMTGSPLSSKGGMGSGSDSFYEYLLKVPLASCNQGHGDKNNQSPEVSCKKDSAAYHMLQLYKDVVDGALRSHHVFRFPHAPQKAYPVEDGDRFHQLLCFLPGMLALGGRHLETRTDDIQLAEELLQGCHDLYTHAPSGLGPESIRIADMHTNDLPPKGNRSYLLRPEHVESIFVLYRLTKDIKYQEMGWEIFSSLEKYCKTKGGYTGLKDVYNPEEDGGRIDDMPSYFLAETLKYLLLLFGPDDYVSLDEFVFTTEAHPIRRNSHLNFANSNDILDASDFRVPAPLLTTLIFIMVSMVGVSSLILIFACGAITINSWSSRRRPGKTL